MNAERRGAAARYRQCACVPGGYAGRCVAGPGRDHYWVSDAFVPDCWIFRTSVCASVRRGTRWTHILDAGYVWYS